jgi:hypothetical protein
MTRRYSQVGGKLQGNNFDVMTEGLDKLAEMGKKVLWEGAQKIRMEG